MTRSHRRLSASFVLVALAVLCWGLSGGIGGVVMARGWDPFVIAFYRGAIGLLCFLAWLSLGPRGDGLGSRRLRGWRVLAGLGVAGNFAFYFLSIAHGSVAVAAVVAMVEPVTAVVFGVAILNESLAASQILDMVLILATVTALSVDSGYQRP